MHASFLAFENMSEEDCVPHFTQNYIWKEMISRGIYIKAKFTATLQMYQYIESKIILQSKILIKIKLNKMFCLQPVNTSW